MRGSPPEGAACSTSLRYCVLWRPPPLEKWISRDHERPSRYFAVSDAATVVMGFNAMSSWLLPALYRGTDVRLPTDDPSSSWWEFIKISPL